MVHDSTLLHTRRKFVSLWSLWPSQLFSGTLTDSPTGTPGEPRRQHRRRSQGPTHGHIILSWPLESRNCARFNTPHSITHTNTFTQHNDATLPSQPIISHVEQIHTHVGTSSLCGRLSGGTMTASPPELRESYGASTADAPKALLIDTSFFLGHSRVVIVHDSTLPIPLHTQTHSHSTTMQHFPASP